MSATFSGGCYLDCHAFLENPRPFDETANECCTILDATLPTTTSDVDSVFVMASLCYCSKQGMDGFVPGMYEVHTKVRC